MKTFVKGTKNYFRRLAFSLILLGISIVIIELFDIEVTNSLRTVVLAIAIFGAWTLEVIYLKMKESKNSKN